MKQIEMPSITTDKRLFFRQWLELISPISKVKGRNADVLAELIFQWNLLKKENIPSSLTWQLLFSTDSKNKMIEHLNIKPAVFRNSLTYLRKKNAIKGNQISKFYLIDINNSNAISTNFKFIFK